MRKLTLSLFLSILFISMLVQYLAAIRIFNRVTDYTIERYYDIDSNITYSCPWYDVRKGKTRIVNYTGEKKRKTPDVAIGVMMKSDKQGAAFLETEVANFRTIYRKSEVDDLLPYYIPNMLDYGEYKGANVIILDLLGDNFLNLLVKSGQPSYTTVCFWAKQMIKALRLIHQSGYVHGDVRPENIAEGVEAHDPNREDVSFKGHAYLNNLGRAETFRVRKGEYKKRRMRSAPEVISPYMSRDTLCGLTQFPRDDMEALGYTLLTITAGALPWFNYSSDEMFQAKDEFFSSDQTVVDGCKAMGMSDEGMINVFRNYFQLLRFKYFADVHHIGEIDYEDLSDCFVYPAKAVQYFGHTSQHLIDDIYNVSKHSGVTNSSDQYYVARVEMSHTPDLRQVVTVIMAIEDDKLVRTGIKVFKDLYSTSGVDNLLKFHIPNMHGYGIYDGKRAIILDSLGDNFMELAGNNGFSHGQYYSAVCFWATQTITALKFIHQQGYVHRDVQPKNIAAGAEDFNLNRTDVSFAGGAYLYNFAVAGRYKHDNGTIKIAQSFEFPYVTSPYASRQALYGCTQYPRDDMEALGYTMLSVTAGALPWSYVSRDDIFQKDSVFRSSQIVEAVCKSMGMVDMGMINVFKNYFALLNSRYFADDDYSREINYEELSACFVYPSNH